MGYLNGPAHVALAIDGISFYPMAFADYAATQDVADRGRVVPDLPPHFVPDTEYTPGGPPRMPEE